VSCDLYSAGKLNVSDETTS